MLAPAVAGGSCDDGGGKGGYVGVQDGEDEAEVTVPIAGGADGGVKGNALVGVAGRIEAVGDAELDRKLWRAGAERFVFSFQVPARLPRLWVTSSTTSSSARSLRIRPAAAGLMPTAFASCFDVNSERANRCSISVL